MKNRDLLARTPIALAIALFIVSAGPATAKKSEQQAASPQYDSSRGVYSWNPMIRQSLESVVRVIKIGDTSEGQKDGVVSSGSGIIIDARKGEILTNHHVVQNAVSVQVHLADGRVATARILGSDAATDIALLKIESSGLQAVSIARSRDVRVGDIAFAVGYPLGLAQTLTMGIISGLGRSGIGDGMEDYIQTDASINSGNSGGALLDSQGRLIGINTAILSSRGGGNIGIGFAVPLDMALAVAAQLREYGQVQRGRVGMALTGLTPDAAQKIGRSSINGALIERVEPQSPAAQAGLQPGDLIVSINGREVTSPAVLTSTIGIMRPGSSFTIDYVRGGKTHSAKLVVAEAKPVLASATGQDGSNPVFFGAIIRNVQPGDPLPEGARAVVITNVQTGSIAARYGLQAGDVIMGINGKRVEGVAGLVTALQEQNFPLTVIIARGNSMIPIVIREE